MTSDEKTEMESHHDHSAPADLHNPAAQDHSGVNQLFPVTYNDFW
jgi:hypothetical protein